MVVTEPPSIANETKCFKSAATTTRVAANGAAPPGAQPKAVTSALRRAPGGAVSGQDPRSGKATEGLHYERAYLRSDGRREQHEEQRLLTMQAVLRLVEDDGRF